METWKESQLKQLTFAKGIESAYAIFLRFAENLGFLRNRSHVTESRSAS